MTDASPYLNALLRLEMEVRTIDQVLAMTGERRAPNRRSLELLREETQRRIANCERLLHAVPDSLKQRADVPELLSLERLQVEE